MDNIRIVLYIILVLLGFSIYNNWQAEQEKSAKPTAAEIANADLPRDQSDPNALEQGQSNGATDALRPVRVKTDVLDLLIDPRGGNIIQSELRDYPIELGQPELVQLQSPSETRFFAVQSGLLSKNGAPNHRDAYQLQDGTAGSVELAEGQDEVSVALVWEDNGIKVTKTYNFKRGDYLIDVRYQVENQSQNEWTGKQYRQLQRADFQEESQLFINTYTGGVYFNEEDKYNKFDFGDIEDGKLEKSFSHGWLAMIQHYFLTAWVPAADETNDYYSKFIKGKTEEQNRYVLGLISPSQRIAAGESGSFSTQLYIGPKLQDRLESIADGLELTVDYGVLTIISKTLYWALDKIHGFVNNWGFAIILLTMVVKLIMYPLSEASYRSMAKMRKVTPEMQKIRERYADDRQRQSQALMELYKKEKINPLGGCLPMLVQIPVFIALYWALLESVELRQAPFILWIQDLSSNDPYFVLPLLMGITMFIQQKLNPPPPDPMQAKIFMMMPVMFTIFFVMFPAGLVLYWVTNNTLSILQQWVITRRIENE